VGLKRGLNPAIPAGSARKIISGFLFGGLGVGIYLGFGVWDFGYRSRSFVREFISW
jgi:hypothetical protein